MTHALPFIDVLGFWVGIFLTFCILSYLYKDNPFYKFAEHLFVGVSIGYVITQQYYTTLRPNLIDHLDDAGWYWYLIPLALVFMLFLKAASRRLSWLGRYPLAFVVALYAGIEINAVAQADLAEQISTSIQPLGAKRVDVNTAEAAAIGKLPGLSPPLAEKIVAERSANGPFASLDDMLARVELSDLQKQDVAAARGSVQGLDAQAAVRPGESYWFGLISRILLLLGLLASLVYFYFSIEQKGPVGKVARFGVWVLMVGFGASFGYTVQGRLSLAVGRAQDVLDRSRDPLHASQIRGPVVALISIAIIVVGLVVWERWQKRPKPPRRPSASAGGAGGAGAGAAGMDEELPEY